MTDEVTVEADTVTLRAGGRVLDTQRRDALARVYAVCPATDMSVTVTDVPLRVFRFDDRLWVLPWTTAGVAAGIAAIWPEPRQRAERCWEAVIDQLPRDWRRLLGERARPQDPAVAVVPASTLPAWRIRREGANSHFVGEHAFPFLDALIAGWFHQDFDITGDTLAAVIASFRQETNADDWAETRADIARLLRRYDDAALSNEFIRLFRPGVDPAAGKVSARQWLARIDDLLRP
jgi:contact-dependent growth inhibition (CDI) system CdiI-like immunity protein